MSIEGRATLREHMLPLLRCVENEVSIEHRMLADDLGIFCTSATIAMLFGSRIKKMSSYDAESMRLVLFKGVKSRHGSPNGFSFATYSDGYDFIFRELLTRDISRRDVLSLADCFRSYPFPIIKRMASDCRANQKFSVSYLVAVLQNESATIIEEARQNSRIEQSIAEAPRPKLPQLRPTSIGEKIERLAEERRIDDILKGN